MEVMFTAPFSLQPFAYGCGGECPDPQKPLHKGKIRIFGLKKLNLNIGESYLSCDGIIARYTIKCK